MLWMLSGVLIGENGVPIDCSKCPCTKDICNRLVTTGSYEIYMTVNRNYITSSHVDWPPEEYVIGQETLTQETATAQLSGVLPASGFIKSNTDRWVSQINGSAYGSWYDSFTMITQDGSDTNWQFIQGRVMDTFIEDNVPRGNGWLIIHCNDLADIAAQVYFGGLLSCMYSDNYTDPEPWNDTLNIFPNNYYWHNFDTNEVRLGNYNNKYIVNGVTLSKNVEQITPQGNYHFEANVVNISLTYIPPPSGN